MKDALIVIAVMIAILGAATICAVRGVLYLMDGNPAWAGWAALAWLNAHWANEYIESKSSD